MNETASNPPPGSFNRVSSLSSPIPHLDPTARSRRLLIETVAELQPFHESLTVIGSHAVYARAEGLFEGYIFESTADADLAVDPAFVGPDPRIIDLMQSAGLERAHPDRPGIYGYAGEAHIPQLTRTTIDLLVPEIFAGRGRRSASITGQRNAATRASGIELALFDRSEMILDTLPIDPNPLRASVHVAGHAALLTAKAHKLMDRLADFERRPHRLRPKDSVDVGLLMLSSQPDEVADTLSRARTEHPAVADLIDTAISFLIEQFSPASPAPLRPELLSGLSTVSHDLEPALDAWLEAFAAATAGLRDRASR